MKPVLYYLQSLGIVVLCYLDVYLFITLLAGNLHFAGCQSVMPCFSLIHWVSLSTCGSLFWSLHRKLCSIAQFWAQLR